MSTPVAGGVTLVDGQQIGACGFDQRGLMRIGAVENLAQNQLGHLARGQFLGEAKAQNALECLVIENARMHHGRHQRFVARDLFGLVADAGPKRIHRLEIRFSKGHHQPFKSRGRDPTVVLSTLTSYQ